MGYRLLLCLPLAAVLVACGSASSTSGGANAPKPGLTGNPAHKMEQPPQDAHWALHTAYSIDGCELDYTDMYTDCPVTTQPTKLELKLNEGDSCAFQWLSYDGPSLMRAFTLRADGTAQVAETSYYEDSDGGYAPQYIQADFKPTEAELATIRKAIMAADVAGAPSRFAREDIYDGLQDRMYLRTGGKSKSISFSNAMPERFRDLMVIIFRDVCANHAAEIDKAPTVKGFIEFEGDDNFPD